MATNIKSVNIGTMTIQCGNGIPTHIGTIPTIYTNLDTALLYFNTDNISNWQELGSSFTGSTSGGTNNPYITGGTYDNPTGTLTLSNNTGGTITITGFTTGSTSSYVFTGGTVTGATNFTGGLTANTINSNVIMSGGTDLQLIITNLLNESPTVTLFNYYNFT